MNLVGRFLAVRHALVMQHASDREILSAVGHGQREFGWDEWFGDVEGADYLTDSGKEAASKYSEVL